MDTRLSEAVAIPGVIGNMESDITRGELPKMRSVQRREEGVYAEASIKNRKIDNDVSLESPSVAI